MTAVAVIGLGKLGAPLAAVLAAHKHHVIGVDLDPKTVETVNAGQPPVQETGLEPLMELAHPWLRATTSIADAVAASTVAFVVVPTPSDNTGRFTNQYVAEAVRAIGAALKSTEHPHYTVAIVSTVMPGSTRGPIQAALEDSSGRECGIDLSLVFHPSFIALGSVLQNITSPDLVLLGCDDEIGARSVLAVLMPVLKSDPMCCAMSTIDAEIAKIALNAFVVMKLNYANYLGELCEHIPGADARNVTRAIGNDRRVGPHYFQPGGPGAGPCFPRDCFAMLMAAQDAGVDAPIVTAAHETNRHQALRIAAKVVDDKRVAILGMTYKTETAITEESLGTQLVKHLDDWEITTATYDPMVPGLTDAATLVKWADAVIVATPWPEFAGLDYTGKRVIDVWGILPPEENIERIGMSHG